MRVDLVAVCVGRIYVANERPASVQVEASIVSSDWKRIISGLVTDRCRNS